MLILNRCNIMPGYKLTALFTISHKTALNLIRSIHECIRYSAHLHQCMLHPVSYKVCVHVCVEWVEPPPAEQLHYTDRCFRETGSDLQPCASTQSDRQQSNETLVSPASCTCPEAWTAAPPPQSVYMSLHILLFGSSVSLLIKQSLLLSDLWQLCKVNLWLLGIFVYFLVDLSIYLKDTFSTILWNHHQNEVLTQDRLGPWIM